MPHSTPEQQARETIDQLLIAAGWAVQDARAANPNAARGVAVREFAVGAGLSRPVGAGSSRSSYADYLLFVDKRPIGVIEAKPAGTTLSGAEPQAALYAAGLPAAFRAKAWRDPLPFLYQSTGVETFFTDLRDPAPRSRRVFAFHKPETLAEWMLGRGIPSSAGNDKMPGNAPSPAQSGAAGECLAATLRARLRTLPPLITTGLWAAQVEAITNLEQSLAADRPRALIQMATGSGKTYTAVSFIYRLIKHAGARRVLFMVDRKNLGQQALKEFQQYVTPDDGRKFTELYNVQLMTSNTLDTVSKVCLTTVQRLYAMLRGDADFDPAVEETSLGDLAALFGNRPVEVAYNPYLPIETFDFIVIDECHRSIYNLWRQVVEYFDAYLIGLTATPAKQTFGFFHQNLVMEYPRERAIADGINVDGWVYRIRTQITEQGSQVEAGEYIAKRDKLTRAQRWEQLDDDLEYSAAQLDRAVVAPDQIRLVIRTFRDRLFTEIFPGRTTVPKTLIFAKDDAHAEEIVRIVREEFAQGNDFCQKITYKVTGKKPEELIAEFRNSFYPRIAVTVDMIATGTDVRPLEILLFMRQVQSANFFEQMRGRGTRVVSETELQAVTPDAARKTCFVLVDAVGVVEQPKLDAGTLDRKRSLSLEKLLEAAAWNVADDDQLASLATRLARLEPQLTDAERDAIRTASGGQTPRTLAHALLDALDPDQALAAATTPTPDAIAAARAALLEQATAPFSNPDLRRQLTQIQARTEIVVDTVSRDRLIGAGYSVEDTQRAREMVASFRAYLEAHRDEITALQVLLSQPYHRRALTLLEIKALAEQFQQPPLVWTTEALWRAYAQLERDRVRGVGAQRVLTDLVALIRHAVQLDDELIPYPEQVQRRFADWLAAQATAGRGFTAEQRWWLEQIAAAIGLNLSVTAEDFGYGELFKRGGWPAAKRVLGPELPALIAELNAALAV